MLSVELWCLCVFHNKNSFVEEVSNDDGYLRIHLGDWFDTSLSFFGFEFAIFCFNMGVFWWIRFPHQDFNPRFSSFQDIFHDFHAFLLNWESFNLFQIGWELILMNVQNYKTIICMLILLFQKLFKHICCVFKV